MPHDPSTSGFMATHGTHRFLALHEQTGLLVGEGKHGVWRFQENGFIRVYRAEGKEGIPAVKKEVVLDLESVEEGEEDEERNRLFEILQNNYKNYDPKFKGDFNYPFHQDYKAPEIEISEEGSNSWLNWIDLPIYHPKFNNTYEDHVPIDLPLFYCQVNIFA